MKGFGNTKIVKEIKFEGAWGGVKGFGNTKIVKEIKFEGAWGELE